MHTVDTKTGVALTVLSGVLCMPDFALLLPVIFFALVPFAPRDSTLTPVLFSMLCMASASTSKSTRPKQERRTYKVSASYFHGYINIYEYVSYLAYE